MNKICNLVSGPKSLCTTVCVLYTIDQTVCMLHAAYLCDFVIKYWKECLLLYNLSILCFWAEWVHNISRLFTSLLGPNVPTRIVISDTLTLWDIIQSKVFIFATEVNARVYLGVG